MPIIVPCSCGKRLRAQDSFAGKRVNCPACKAVLTVPLPEGAIPELDHIEVCDDDENDGGAYGLNPEDAKLAALLPGQGGGDSRFSGGVGVIKLNRQERPAHCLAYSPDHCWALAAQEETIYVLDMRQGKKAFKFREQGDTVKSMAFSPGGKLVLSGDQSGGLLLWNVAKGRRLRWFESHQEAVTSVAFSPSGKLAVSGDNSGYLQLWQVETGKRLKLHEADGFRAIECVAFSPDGAQVAAAGDRGHVGLWNVKSGEPEHELRGGGNIDSIAYSKDGDSLVGVGLDSFFNSGLGLSRTGLQVSKWSTRSGKRQSCFTDPYKNRAKVNHAAVVPGAEYILSAGQLPPEQKQGEGDRGSVLEFLGQMNDGIAGLLDSMDAGGPTWCLQLWNVATGYVSKSFEDITSSSCFAISQDGRRALAAGKNRTVSVWSLPY